MEISIYWGFILFHSHLLLDPFDTFYSHIHHQGGCMEANMFGWYKAIMIMQILDKTMVEDEEYAGFCGQLRCLKILLVK